LSCISICFMSRKIVFLGFCILVFGSFIPGCQLFGNVPISPGTSTRTDQSSNIPPEIVSFTGSPVELFIGQSAILTWEVKGAYEIDISPNLGYVPAKGTKTVTPVDTTTYTLKAVNKEGASASKKVAISINKNVKAVDLALTEDDVRSRGFKFNMNTEPQAEGCSSTYRILFTSGRTTIENTIYIYDAKSFMMKVFNEDKYNSRVDITNPLYLIGDEGYVMTNKSSEPDESSYYSIKYIKKNVYVKVLGNVPFDWLEGYARLVEKKIQ
jgi:hypothetical protein